MSDQIAPRLTGLDLALSLRTLSGPQTGLLMSLSFSIELERPSLRGRACFPLCTILKISRTEFQFYIIFLACSGIVLVMALSLRP